MRLARASVGGCSATVNGVRLQTLKLGLVSSLLGYSSGSFYTSERNNVVRIYFFFEPGICERRLTLDLHHGAAFATLSKPLQPLACFSPS
jgi:hypothetical protein